MKKNKMMRLASVLLVLCLLTTSVISGTFAKYTSEATASDDARVARWAFKVGDANIAKSETITFDLFQTIYDTDGSAETDVQNKLGDGKTVIAPGTSGYFEIKLQNTSEVTANYAIDYTVTNNIGAHIQFSVDNGATWTDDLADVAVSDETTLAIGSGVETIKVMWKWAYESTTDTNWDADDTTLGIAEDLATLTVAAKITATQVD